VNPGPGAYEKIDSMSKSGKFPISKFKTYGVAVIHPKCEHRQMSKSCNTDSIIIRVGSWSL